MWPPNSWLPRLRAWLRPAPGREDSVPGEARVVLLDGTLSSLEPGHETSIGLTYKMLHEAGATCLYYEPGIQWGGVRRAPEVMAGVGINRQIRRAYAYLARRYAPGDRIYLMGYSRGAYAVRALAGMIDRVGLVRPELVSDATVRAAYEHYRHDPSRAEARDWAARHCHPEARIEAVGVFDTVKAVGVRWPVLWRLFPEVHAFRSDRLGQCVAHGFHALALDETRLAFRPEIWRTDGRRGSVHQVWFRGAHPDLGGHTSGEARFRPLANVPLIWMLERMEAVGLVLPEGWRARFPADAEGPSVGTWRRFGALFWRRKRRLIGADPSERVHPSAVGAVPELSVWGGTRKGAAAE